jgi:hypothetical protein
MIIFLILRLNFELKEERLFSVFRKIYHAPYFSLYFEIPFN